MTDVLTWKNGTTTTTKKNKLDVRYIHKTTFSGRLFDRSKMVHVGARLKKS